MHEHPEIPEAHSVFNATVLSLETSSLTRMVREAVLIRDYRGDNLLNDKLEYNRCLLPELVTRVGKLCIENDDPNLPPLMTLG